MPRTKYSKSGAERKKEQRAKQRPATNDAVINVHGSKVLLARFFPDNDEYIEGMDALREMIKDYEYTAKEAAFIIHYLEDYNGKAAAIKAGYAESWAATAAHDLLRLDKIRYRIALEMAEIYSRSVMTVLERKEILTRIGRGDISDFATIKNGNLQIDPEALKNAKTKGTIKRIKVERAPSQFGDCVRTEFELHDSKDAIDKLNRMEKVYEDRLNIGITLVDIDKEDAAL